MVFRVLVLSGLRARPHTTSYPGQQGAKGNVTKISYSEFGLSVNETSFLFRVFIYSFMELVFIFPIELKENVKKTSALLSCLDLRTETQFKFIRWTDETHRILAFNT
ncbi:hypothetical protein AVEN_139262-1 [Araneus ventricosus]|uniref:Uncharacterized protein n=1 Tax=Araneus ventricosus TaxID=182803 RepID=A0A4Y2SK46_ARAVE|nr:hypothetical protein AVEN_139262-1 [Araneus ventricosus]